MLQCLFHHKTEMRALGAITIKILSLIFMFLKGGRKHLLRLFYLVSDLGQVTYFQRGAIFIDQSFYSNSIKLQVAIFHFKAFLRKIESLLNKVEIGICH